MKVQIFFDSFKKDFDEFEKLGEEILKKQQKIMNFNYPNDTLFNKWMENLAQKISWYLKKLMKMRWT